MQTAHLIITTIFSFALPIGLMIYWKNRHKLTMFPFVTGALCFLLFAMGLEQILHMFCIGTDNPVSRAIQANPWLYVLYGCLTAGIFEETGRLFGFKFLLRNYKEKEISVAYGIGHGGIETIMTLGLTYGMLTLASLGVKFGDSAAQTAIMESIQNTSVGEMCLAMLERVSAMMIHIGLSIIVFIAANRKNKMGFYALAIVLHALANFAVGMYQVKLLNNVILVEIIAFVCGAGILALGIMLYKKMGEEK